METAKLFENGKSQAVRLPKKYRMPGTEVVVQRLGHAIILVPKENVWETFMSGINSFTDDFMPEGRKEEISAMRETL
ncbi:MAG: AbrB/MazE/SpoVT family DNA-binding domain-containing protein [Phascolarctobacterium sp.]|nr:MAG: AbrB/MazE/SpoVT family DNA-binding domain-containing protein [Phascolarctobacterium sp.]